MAELTGESGEGDIEALRLLVHGPATHVTERGRLERLLRTDQRFYLQDQVLVKADRASMACSPRSGRRS